MVWVAPVARAMETILMAPMLVTKASAEAITTDRVTRVVDGAEITTRRRIRI